MLSGGSRFKRGKFNSTSAEGMFPMTKTTKALITSAAFAGLLAGTGSALYAAPLSPSSSKPSVSSQDKDKKDDSAPKEKHACKGKNSCKGNGGCKSGDNGCKGKNSCKGKGGCATDGSKPAETPKP
jgi:hypothetical protein